MKRGMILAIFLYMLMQPAHAQRIFVPLSGGGVAEMGTAQASPIPVMQPMNYPTPLPGPSFSQMARPMMPCTPVGGYGGGGFSGFNGFGGFSGYR